MSNRGAAVLGVRLLALYFFLQGLTGLPAAAQPAGQEDWPVLVGLLAPLLLGVLFWLGAGQVASRMLPQRTAIPPHPAGSLHDWYALAFAAVGLLVSLHALPPLLVLAAEAWQRARELQALGFVRTVELAAAGLKLALGLAALLGSRGLAGVVIRLRTGGLGYVSS